MQARFTFYLGDQEVETLTATLVDTPGARAWAYAVLLNTRKREVMPYNTAKPVETNVSERSVAYKQVINCLEQLVGTEFEYQGVVLDEHSYDQSWLNVVHRHFTNCCQRLWADDYADYDKQAKFDPILQVLNLQIHQLERYVTTTYKQKWGTTEAQELLLKSDELSFDIKPFHSCHTFEYSDIVLDAHILGKTLVESFFCDDDPIQWDTSGHVRTAGGCSFMLTDHRQQIYDSPEFDEWLTKHNTTRENVFANFPLGNWLPGDKDKLDSMLDRLGSNAYNTKCSIDILL